MIKIVLLLIIISLIGIIYFAKKSKEQAIAYGIYATFIIIMFLIFAAIT